LTAGSITVRLHGAPDAERVVVLMARQRCGGRHRAGAHGAARRSASVRAPLPTVLGRCVRGGAARDVRSIAVLDRTKEPGAPGALYQDVVTALAEQVAAGRLAGMPRVIGGRYGLASKEFNRRWPRPCSTSSPRSSEEPLHGGIVDDVTFTSLEVDQSFTTESDDVVRLVLRLGADGTVSATRAP